MIAGRPSKSVVRDNLMELLFVFGKLTAYDAHKHYIKLFAKTSRRNVYYQLQKGCDTGLFDKEQVTEKGDYSWGTESKKVYYTLKTKEGLQLNKNIVDYYKNYKKLQKGETNENN